MSWWGPSQVFRRVRSPNTRKATKSAVDQYNEWRKWRTMQFQNQIPPPALYWGDADVLYITTVPLHRPSNSENVSPGLRRVDPQAEVELLIKNYWLFSTSFHEVAQDPGPPDTTPNHPYSRGRDSARSRWQEQVIIYHAVKISSWKNHYSI